MNVELSLNSNSWLLKMEGKYAGKSFKTKYRDKYHIKEFVEILDAPISVYFGINDVKLYYNDCTITLKNYKKNKDRYLYKKIINKLDSQTVIARTLSANLKKLSNVKIKKIVKKSNFVSIVTSFAISSLISLNKPIHVSDEKLPIYTNNVLYSEFNNFDIVPEEDFKKDNYISLDDRIMQTENIKFSSSGGNFDVCSKLDDYTLNKMTIHMEKNEEIYKNASLKYGVDPYLLLAFSMTETSLMHDETIPGGKYYNGYATGAMQIENTHIGEDLTAYNYQDDTYETVKITKEKLIDLNSNVEIGAMMIQNCLNRYNNNVYISIQAHNYGTSVMDIIIKKYADEIGKTFEEVTLDNTDFGWMKYVDDIHNNPKKYFSNWKSKTYGNNKYIYSVLGYYIGQNIINNNKDNYYIYDLVSNTCTLERKDNKQNIYDPLLNKNDSEILNNEDPIQRTR